MKKKVVEEKRIPIVEEELRVEKRSRETGRVRVSTAVDERTEWVRETLSSEGVEVERTPIGRQVDSLPGIREEDGDLIIPVVEEILVIEKRWMLKEELRLRRVRRTEQVEKPVRLRSTRVDVQRTGAGEVSASSRRPAADRGRERT